jgi:hypothetical protein
VAERPAVTFVFNKLLSVLQIKTTNCIQFNVLMYKIATCFGAHSSTISWTAEQNSRQKKLSLVVRSSEANMCTVIGAACGLVYVRGAKLLQVKVKKCFLHLELQITRDPFSVIIVLAH